MESPGEGMPRAGISATGKVSSDVFARVIFPRLGENREAVHVGPRAGVDVGIVDVAPGRVMAVTTDPLFVMPEYGWERAAWFAVHIVASDVATSGFVPSLCTIDLNLPVSVTDRELSDLWEGLHAACGGIGLAVAAGHTGRYHGCAYPMLGGCTVMGFGPSDAYVTAAMAKAGDVVILTKGAAIETTGQLGVVAEVEIAGRLGRGVAREAVDLFWQMSVVRDARVAVQAVGVRGAGISSMHDATERGVWGALVEVADASGVGLAIDQGAIPLPRAVQQVCALFAIDPLSSSSEGTLVITCNPAGAEAIIGALGDAGIEAARVGQVVPAGEGLTVTSDGRMRPLTMPDDDPFWGAMQRATAGRT